MDQDRNGLGGEDSDLYAGMVLWNDAEELAFTYSHWILAGTKLVAASTFSCDPVGRLQGLSHRQNTTTLGSYTCSYDTANRVTAFHRRLASHRGWRRARLAMPYRLPSGSPGARHRTTLRRW